MERSAEPKIPKERISILQKTKPWLRKRNHQTQMTLLILIILVLVGYYIVLGLLLIVMMITLCTYCSLVCLEEEKKEGEKVNDDNAINLSSTATEKGRGGKKGVNSRQVDSLLEPGDMLYYNSPHTSGQLKTEVKFPPSSINNTSRPRFRSLLRQPSLKPDNLAVSWHPRSLSAPDVTSQSVLPTHAERGVDDDNAINLSSTATEKGRGGEKGDNSRQVDSLLEPGDMLYNSPHTSGQLKTEVKFPPSSINNTSRPRFRSLLRQPSLKPDNLAVSWHPRSLSAPDVTSQSVLPTYAERGELRRRPSIMKQASTSFALRRQGRQKQKSFRLPRGSQMNQVQIIDDEKQHPSRKKLKWWHGIFVFSFISLLVCLLQLFLPPPFGLMMTSTEVAEGGIAPGCEDGLERCICPRESICATDKLSIILLVLARSSAFFDYPLYMMLFLSKAHNLNNHMRRTIFREWINFGDMHSVHKIFGIVVGIETMFHSFFHLLRWGLNNEIDLLWKTAAGITGLIAAAVTPLICWPMVIPYLKHRISFEMRKGLHYLFVVWAVALLYHAPSRMMPLLVGIPALIYAVDFSFGYLKKNNLVETAYFERYGENGVAVHIKNPKSWEDRPPTSYVYIMCPWISKYEWHAFTMFPEQSKENHSMLCIGASGNWTKQLLDKIKTPCLRQLYVHGPFMTEFSDQAITTSNAIAVATGVGITPTLSLMLNYVGRKRINIIWSCRDAGLIEYVLHNIGIGEITKNSFAFIFYTGKRELALPKNLPVNLFILRRRPDLENTITGIITAIHSGEGLPEHLYEKQKKISDVPFRRRLMIALSRVTQTYDESEMFDYAVKETKRAAERVQALDLEAAVRPSHSGNDYGIRRPSVASPEEIPEDHVSLLGLDAMISHFLGLIGEYSLSDIEEFFDTIDRNRSGFVNREDFSAFLNMATGGNNVKEERRPSSGYFLSSMVELTEMEAALSTSMHNSVRGSSSPRAARVFGESNTEEYVETLMNDAVGSGEKPLDEWSIFYCGGSNAVKKDLKEISKRYKLDFAVEKFDW